MIRAILGLLPGGGKGNQQDRSHFEGEDLLAYEYTETMEKTARYSEISMIFQDSGAMMNPTRKIGTVFTEYHSDP